MNSGVISILLSLIGAGYALPANSRNATRIHTDRGFGHIQGSLPELPQYAKSCCSALTNRLAGHLVATQSAAVSFDPFPGHRQNAGYSAFVKKALINCSSVQLEI